MSKDLLYSFILHFVILGTVLITSPFDHSKRMEFGEVIKVSLKSMAEIKSEPVSIKPPATPQAVMTEETIEIPIDDPQTVKEAKEVEKKDEPPKPKKEDKPPPPNQAANATDTDEKPDEKEIESKSTESGQMFAGATVHNESFDYPYWFDQAFGKIHANFSNPVSSDAPITTTVYFEIIQSGRVIMTKVVESSGIPRYDDACVKAIERSAPFPPLPRSFNDEIIGITLPMTFDPHMKTN